MLTHDLEVAIRSLEDQPLNALKGGWEKAFGAPPPRGTSRKLMTRALAHNLQVKAFGGLGKSSRKKLLKKIPPKEATRTIRSSKLPVGTRLMREWNGTHHRVDVTEDGLHWNGRTWSSLSVIAREITGTRWNGPLFFGLRTPGGKRGETAV